MKKKEPSTAYVKTCIAFFGMFFLLASVPPMATPMGRSQEDGILAFGTSTIFHGNLATAKEAAISRALSKGMEDYLVGRLGPEVMIDNFERIVRDLIPHARDGIENFHILAADQTGDDYNVLVRLRVNQKVMDEKLRTAGIAIMKGPAIKVLFMVLEAVDGQFSYWWRYSDSLPALSAVELTLHNAFQKRAFSPVNRLSNVPETEISGDMRSPDLTEEAAAAWGRLYGADVVIVGRIETLDNEKASLLLKSVSVRGVKTVFQGERTGPIEIDPEGNAQTSETFGRLINQLASRMTPVIRQASQWGRERTHRVPVTLTGLKTYRQFKDFKNFLTKYVSGVKSVKQTRVSKNSISVEVGFEGDEMKLLESILGHEKLPLLMDGRMTEDGRILIEIE